MASKKQQEQPTTRGDLLNSSRISDIITKQKNNDEDNPDYFEQQNKIFINKLNFVCRTYEQTHTDVSGNRCFNEDFISVKNAHMFICLVSLGQTIGQVY